MRNRSTAGLVACVVDAEPRFHLQALRWFATLTRCAGVPADELAVFDAGAEPESEVLAALRGRGVRVRRVEAFDPRCPPCNKIGALAAAAAEAEGVVAFSDCDLAFLADPRALLADPGALHASPVHRANPPLGVLERVLAARGLPLGETHALALYPDKLTCAGNANGGLYVASAQVLRVLTADWAREARWLLDRRELLGEWAGNVDQVSMLLALRSGGRAFRRLAPGANLPTGDPGLGKLPAEAIGPLVGLHYHEHVTPQGRLKAPGVPCVDAGIERANEAIREEFQRFFPNATFWAWRYGRDPELGSGVGSRGAALQAKRELIGLLAAAVAPESTLDVGCGDGAAVDGIALGRYRGLDLAPNAGGLLTDGKALECRSLEATDRADLTLCLDVGIHQSDARGWEALVARVVASARRMALISGFESGAPASLMVHFHRPLSAALAQHAAGRWTLPVGAGPGPATFAVLVPPGTRIDGDLQRATLERLPGELRLGPELAALLACAWRGGIAYPDRVERLWEYPAALRALRSQLAPGASVLDLSGEPNALAALLRALGYRVSFAAGAERVDAMVAVGARSRGEVEAAGGEIVAASTARLDGREAGFVVAKPRA